MILMDRRVRTRTLDTGIFRCPRESGNRHYRLNAVRRWLFAGPVPLLRLGELGRYVECQSCASTFEPAILTTSSETPTEDVLTRALRYAVGLLLSAEDTLSADYRREAVIVVQHYANVPYNSQDLQHDLRHPADLQAHLTDLAASLNEHGRTVVRDATVELATQGDAATEARVEALQNVADAIVIPTDARCIDTLLGGRGRAFTA